MSPEAAHALDDVFTEDEISRALKRCKRGKSGGPDELPNAWFQDHADAVIPILTLLFNVCYREGECPGSFLDETVVCLPKAGRTSDAMGYRPISLLNTDYKVLTKALVARVKPLLPTLVNVDQGGFVPGRDIHEVIDTFTAAQAIARHYQQRTVAVVLDIRKAYDTVHRPLLHACLQHRGFPPKFRTMILATHTNTLARFRVNGYLSEAVTLERGIRQGCPLAPLLFVLVLDPLYRWLRQDPGLRDPFPGLDITASQVAGFADDTAVYLADETRMPQLLEVLVDFAAASGLTVNTEKSVAIRLWADAGSLPKDTVFRALSMTAFCRYLGIQVGTQVAEDAVWQLTLEQLTCRLRLAERKTHSPAQRAQLATAIVIPKCLFVARHHWPTTARVHELDARVQSFVWDGDFVGREIGKTRRWMRQSLAKLPTHQGGLGIPCIRTELHILSTMVVATWAYASAAERDQTVKNARWLDGEERLHPRTILGGQDPRLHHGPSLWKDGASRLGVLCSSRLSPTLQVMIKDGLDALSQHSMEWRWTNQGYERNFSSFYRAGGSEIRDRRCQELGKSVTDWIPYVHATGASSGLMHKDGGLYKRSHVSALGDGVEISDMVAWSWVRPFVLHFTPTSIKYPLSNQAALQFRNLCDAIVANFPDILRRPRVTTVISEYHTDGTMDREWRFEDNTLIQVEEGVVVGTRRVTSQRELQSGSRGCTGTPQSRPSYACIPQLTKIAKVDMVDRPWCPDRRYLKRGLTATLWARGQRAASRRRQAWDDDDETVASALAKTKWTTMLKAPGFSSYDSQLWHRLRLHQLLLWPTGNNEAQCLHEHCDQPYDASTGHIVWRCDAAQALWRQVFGLWTRNTHRDDWKDAIFGWEAPVTERDWIEGLPDEVTTAPDFHDRLDRWIQTLWQLLITCAIQRLWAEQVRLLFPAKDRWIDDFHAVIAHWRAKSQHVLDALMRAEHDTAAVDLGILRGLIHQLSASDDEVPRFELQQDQYLMFFDGGRRGNPGPGGSGSVVVRMSSPPTIMWMSAISYARKTTTNNYAEFQGLCHGLAALHQNRWHPAAILGDSQMIIGLLRRHTPAKSGILKPLYARASALAHRLHITGWHHHYRDRNKMADKAANIAMDTCSSLQAHVASGRAEFVQLAQYLDSDIQPWLQRRLLGQDQFDPA